MPIATLKLNESVSPMTEAFNLLDVQPDSWPRWETGAYPNALSTSDRHLFLLELIGVGAHTFGRVYPACHFVDGAEFVAYTQGPDASPGNVLPFCGDCLEVELQHALTTLA